MQILLAMMVLSMVSSFFFFPCIPFQFFSGWGETGEDTATDKLQETVVSIVENSNCVERQYNTFDTDTIICSGGTGKGPCKVHCVSNVTRT